MTELRKQDALRQAQEKEELERNELKLLEYRLSLTGQGHGHNQTSPTYDKTGEMGNHSDGEQFPHGAESNNKKLGAKRNETTGFILFSFVFFKICRPIKGLQ